MAFSTSAINIGSAPGAGDGDPLRSALQKARDTLAEADQRLNALEARPSGGNITAGTQDFQVPAWSVAGNNYTPYPSIDIQRLRLRLVELSATTALTFADHNGTLLSCVAGISLSLAQTEIGLGMHFLLTSEYSGGAVGLTFGAGVTVRKMSNVSGTGQAVSLPAYGLLSVLCYPRGSTTIAKVAGAAP